VTAPGTSHVGELVALLRSAGLSIPVGSLAAFVEAVSLLDDDPASVYWAGRTTLAHDELTIATYDVVFRAWMLGAETDHSSTGTESTVEREVLTDGGAEDGPDDGPDGGDDGDPVTSPRASGIEVLRTRDFAALDDDERAEVDRLLERLRPRTAPRRSRRRRPRRVPVRRADDRLDLRRTVQHSLRTDGETLSHRSLRRIGRGPGSRCSPWAPVSRGSPGN